MKVATGRRLICLKVFYEKVTSKDKILILIPRPYQRFNSVHIHSAADFKTDRLFSDTYKDFVHRAGENFIHQTVFDGLSPWQYSLHFCNLDVQLPL